MSATQTVFVSIGNSDDKLTQKEWAQFCTDLNATVRGLTTRVLGEWYSKPGEQWQNMCVASDLDPGALQALLVALEAMRKVYRQDSIAVLPGTTYFVDGSLSALTKE
jgi:hypothetical protein